MKRGAIAFALPVASLIAVGVSCRDATQVTLDISYGDPCARLKSVGIIATTDAIAAEQRATSGEYTTVTTSCTDGANLTSKVGTLSITPGDGKTRAAITIVAGVDTPADRCRPETQFKGCIVARRSFAFLASAGPTFPIRLDPDCKDVPCDAQTTCKKGACVDAAADCNDDTCVDRVPDDPPREDGGGPDATTDSPTDAGSDSTTTVDAPVDAPIPDTGVDADSPTLCPPGPNAPRICPPYVDPGTPCAMNCAMSGSGAQCTPVTGQFNAQCTASRQCAPSQNCCWGGGSSTLASCVSGSCGGAILCRGNCDCDTLPGTTCQFGDGVAQPPFVKVCRP